MLYNVVGGKYIISGTAFPFLATDPDASNVKMATLKPRQTKQKNQIRILVIKSPYPCFGDDPFGSSQFQTTATKQANKNKQPQKQKEKTYH